MNPQQVTNEKPIGDLLPYQELKIDINEHFGNFISCLTGGLDHRLPPFQPTDVIKFVDPITKRDKMYAIKNCSMHSLVSYWKLLQHLCDGRDNAMGFLRHYLHATGVSSILSEFSLWERKLDSVQNGRLDMDLTPEQWLDREIPTVAEEMQIYCRPTGSTFCYYLWNTSNRSFMQINQSVMLTHMLENLTARVGDEKLVKSKKDIILLHLQLHRQVDAVGPMAGYDAGMIDLPGGNRWLVSRPPLYRLVPVPGEYDLVTAYLESRFCPEQLPYLIGWLSQCVKSLYAPDRYDYENPYMTQACILLGDGNVGKSYFQENFLSKIFWGRHAEYGNLLIGKDTFNAERSTCEHLLVGDFAIASGSKPESIRQHVTHHTKGVVANMTFPARPMYGSQQTVYNRNILTISTNLARENIAVLPDIDNVDLRDKVMMFLMMETGKDFCMTRWSELVKQLPAFIHHLVNLPAVDAGYRFGVRAYIHPHIKQLRSEVDGSVDYSEDEIRFLEGLLLYLDENTTLLEKGISKFLIRAMAKREVLEIPKEHIREGCSVPSNKLLAKAQSVGLLSYVEVLEWRRGRKTLPGLMQALVEESPAFIRKQWTWDDKFNSKRSNGIAYEPIE